VSVSSGTGSRFACVVSPSGEWNELINTPVHDGSHFSHFPIVHAHRK